jgi:hypothetical protein
VTRWLLRIAVALSALCLGYSPTNPWVLLFLIPMGAVALLIWEDFRRSGKS